MSTKVLQHPLPEIHSYAELRGYLREDYVVNERSVWSPGFQALLAYRLGVWRNTIRSRPKRMLVTLVYAPLAWISRSVYGIELGPRTRVGRRLRIAHQHGIVIHPRVVIGDDCMIRQGVTIGVAQTGARAPVLGNRVGVGAGAVIAGSVTIGDGATIGPNAVVMTNVPAGSVVATPPPRIMTPPPRRAAVEGGRGMEQAAPAGHPNGKAVPDPAAAGS